MWEPDPHIMRAGGSVSKNQRECHYMGDWLPVTLPLATPDKGSQKECHREPVPHIISLLLAPSDTPSGSHYMGDWLQQRHSLWLHLGT